ncbi:hypothetical protein CH373_09830 [Leptospira perolatii]|uniref:Chemotaxis protein n=1 Tax=Leptospira perolatii TaxID=2023191 RepID=A0A2M9ZMG6_9LEPT|nr:hypothetical protein [Leptospira perolatii]PJZ70084.1 hypothetical protein CH360_07575 [Leptospira perolatii]PJZ73272.1 hypothetical protein CH373_09830 [Leptospira perolatii]
MEKAVMDLLNAGIALFQSGEGKLKQTLHDVEKVYDELKAKGALDQSEQANRLRDLVQKTVADAQSKLHTASEGSQAVYQQLKDNFQKISVQVEEMVPPDLKAKAKSALDELKKLTKKP